MIRSFRHCGIERFFRTDSKSGIQPKHAKRLRLQLARLDSAIGPDDMNLPGWRLHSLKAICADIGLCGSMRTGGLHFASMARTPN